MTPEQFTQLVRECRLAQKDAQLHNGQSTYVLALTKAKELEERLDWAMFHNSHLHLEIMHLASQMRNAQRCKSKTAKALEASVDQHLLEHITEFPQLNFFTNV